MSEGNEFSLENNKIEKIDVNLDSGELAKKIQIVLLKDGRCEFEWEDTVPIPEADSWFENVWNAFMRDEIIIK